MVAGCYREGLRNEGFFIYLLVRNAFVNHQGWTMIKDICRARVLLGFSLLVLAGLLSSCVSLSPESHSKLKGQVESRIKDEDSVAGAASKLEKLGFSCRDGSVFDLKGLKVWECTRARSSILLFGCAHRVWLFPGLNGSDLKAYEIFEPGCTGM